MRVGVLAIGVLILAAACASERAPSSTLLGRWEAVSANASGSSFEFRADGTATWSLHKPFEIQYRADATALDLFGFQEGPLQGRTLYCLTELGSKDRFRMDCEPTARPTTLDPAQAQEFARR